MAVELHLTIGLPGSGKTTWARAFVDARTADGYRVARVNRDDLRVMLFGRLTGVPENQVTDAAHAAVTALLSAGVSVVCDDTNLHSGHRERLTALAAGCGARVIEHPEFLDVPVDECIRRDLSRGINRVGAAAIARLAELARDTYRTTR